MRKNIIAIALIGLMLCNTDKSFGQSTSSGLGNNPSPGGGDYLGWANGNAIPLKIQNINAQPIEFYTGTGPTQYMTILGSTNPGYVGIGTATPSNLLHLYNSGSGAALYCQWSNGNGSNTNGLQVGINTSNQGMLNMVDNKPIKILTNNVVRMIVDDNGNNGYIGIGTSFTTPFSKLHLHNSGNTDNWFQISTANSVTSALAATDGLRIGVIDATQVVQINQQENADMNFQTNATQRMTILAAGNVGVNTAGPDRKLDILDAGNPQLRLTYTDGSKYCDLQTTVNGDLIVTPTGTTERAVGVGTTGPNAKLHVVNSAFVGASGYPIGIQADVTSGGLVALAGQFSASGGSGASSVNEALLLSATGGESAVGTYMTTTNGTVITEGIHMVTSNSATTGNAPVYGVYAGTSYATTSTSTLYGHFQELTGAASSSNLNMYGHFDRINFGNQYANKVYGGAIGINGTSNEAYGLDIGFGGTIAHKMYGVKVSTAGGGYLSNSSAGDESYGGYFSNGAGGYDAYGVYAATSGGTNKNYAVYASVGTSCTQSSGCNDWGVYSNGAIATSAGFFAASDAQLKDNITPLADAKQILSQLEPKSYTYNATYMQKMNLPDGTHYGFLADDVENVIPGAIREVAQPTQVDAQGNTIQEFNYKSMNYNEVIPVLTAVVKGQAAQIDSLINALSAQQRQINPNGNNNSNEQMKVELGSSNKIIHLSENNPNPFKDNTQISFIIPEDVKSASIMFSDNKGSIIKTVEINSRGENSLMVFGENLSNGIYSYTLIIDGKVFETKRMVKQ